MSALAAIRQATEANQREPLRYARWSKWQRDFLADDSQLRLVRAANQIGKTTAAVADIVHLIRGSNPYRPRRWKGPINVVLLSESIEQMSQEGAILEKLWQVIPKDEIDPTIYFERGRGLRGCKYPAIPFIKGPGAGSVIRMRTYQQDPKTLAGMTVHAVYCDEPCPARTFGELRPRILKHNGTFTITFTPTPSQPPQDWLRELVEKEIFHEHHAVLSLENVWPEGNRRPFLSQEQIDGFIGSLLEVERKMRVEATWEPLVEGRWLTNFRDRNIRAFDLAEIPADAYVVVGIDHGLQAGKQTAALVVVSGRHEPEPRAWYVDEVQSDGYTTPEQDAAAILGMLGRHGLRYESVDQWIGDRNTGDGLVLKSKTNADLRRCLLRQAGITSHHRSAKRIDTPHKWNGSVIHGLRLMNAGFARETDGQPHHVVHPRCERLIEACQRFAGNSRDPVKDILDAARYAYEKAVAGSKITSVRARAS